MKTQALHILLALALLSSISYADAQKGYEHFRKAQGAYINQDFVQAKPLLTAALKEVGANDPYRLDILKLLAFIYTKEQQYEQALPFWQEASQIVDNQKTPSITSMEAYSGLASTYLSLKQLPQALSALEKTAELQKTHLGADHVELARTQANIGTISLQLGNADQARNAYQAALPILQKNLPPTDPFLQQVQHNYQVSKINNMAVVTVSAEIMEWINKGDQALQSGNQAQALQAYQSALDEALKTKGNRHPALAILQDKIKQATRLSTHTHYFAQLDPEVTRWHDKTKKIVVYIQPGASHRYWKPEYDELIKKAFATWEEALNHKHEIIYAERPDNVDVFVTWYDKPIFQHQAGLKQIGINQFDSTDEYMTKNDIDIILDGPIDDPEFLYSTLLHEIGHLMGLRGHSDNPNDIMFSAAQVGWKSVRELSKRDIETIQLLYKTPASITNRPGKHLSSMN